MKPFNLEEAKAGKPVCDRIGYDVRIVCDNKKDPYGYLIVALHLNDKDNELMISHKRDGKMTDSGISPYDLFMKSEKKEGWVNIYKGACNEHLCCNHIYSTKEEAIEKAANSCIANAKIEWEE